MKQYHLHKEGFSKLHFEINDGASYFLKNKEHSAIPHKHTFYQLIWFKSKGRHYVDYHTIEHEENTLFLISKNQIHHFCPDSVNDGIIIHFNSFFIDQFDHDLLERISLSIFNEIDIPYIQINNTEKQRFLTICSLIQEEIEINDQYLKEQIFSLFRSLLLTIERTKLTITENNSLTNEDFQLAYQFKKEVYNNINKFLSLEAYYEILGTNKKKLTKVSKEQLNSSPSKVIQDIKILEAKRNLANRKLSIQEIAYDLGFDQATYFTKYFKKSVGISPKEFRSSIL